MLGHGEALLECEAAVKGVSTCIAPLASPLIPFLVNIG